MNRNRDYPNTKLRNSKAHLRSARCIGPLREIAWLLAAYDVIVTCAWIPMDQNVQADLGSRAFDESTDPLAVQRMVEEYLGGEGADPRLQYWSPRAPARPELLLHVPVADVDGFFGPEFDPTADEATRLRAAWSFGQPHAHAWSRQ
eukprot:SAG11_NODE_2296_length_3554_cov_3.189870_3_plen_146_part_00